MSDFDPRGVMLPMGHVKLASTVLKLIAVLCALLGAILLAGGIYLAGSEKFAFTTFRLFGNDFSSTSVGVAMAFIGAVLVILVFLRILKSVDHLAGLPKTDLEIEKLETERSEKLRADVRVHYSNNGRSERLVIENR